MKIIFTILGFCVITFSSAQVNEGLVGHFKLDAQSFTDETGNGSGTISTRGNGNFSDVSDKTGTNLKATKFQGGIIEATSNTRDITNEISVSCWIKTTNADVDVRPIVSQYYCTSHSGYLLFLNNGRVGFDTKSMNKPYTLSSRSDSINDDEWHHIVGTLDSTGEVNVWVDGQRVGTVNGPSISSLFSGCNTAIGGFSELNTKNNGKEYLGDLDELRIYNRALDSLDIDTLFQYPSTLSVKRQNESSFKTYPNPVKETLFIDGLNSINNYIIYNSVGQVILTGQTIKQINVAKLTKGTYTLILEGQNGDSRGYSKFIK